MTPELGRFGWAAEWHVRMSRAPRRHAVSTWGTLGVTFRCYTLTAQNPFRDGPVAAGKANALHVIEELIGESQEWRCATCINSAQDGAVW